MFLLTNLYVLFKIRDILGMVNTTKEHTEATISSIAESGMFAQTAHQLVFTGDEHLPYVCALSFDLPIQLTLLYEYCKAKNIPLDTTAMNCSQSELLNKQLKALIHRASSHSHVDGTEAKMENHTQSECFRAFSHELMVKEKCFVLDMHKLAEVDDLEEELAERKDSQRILPQNSECKLCGLLPTERAHILICDHVLLPDLISSAREGKRVGHLARLLEESAATEVMAPCVELEISSDANSTGGHGRGRGRGERGRGDGRGGHRGGGGRAARKELRTVKQQKLR